MLKNRKKAGIFGAVALLVAAWGLDEEIQKNTINEQIIQEELSENDNLNGKDASYVYNLREFFTNYQKYFSKYLNKSQKQELKEVVRTCETDNITTLLNDITKGDSLSQSFSAIFNSYLVYANNLDEFYQTDYVAEHHFLVLKDLCHNDDAFYTALFSGDGQKVIDCIRENTGAKEESIKTLALLFERYYDYIGNLNYLLYSTDDLDNMTGSQKHIIISQDCEQILESYDHQIRSIMQEIIESKKKQDPSFQKTLLYNLLINTNYYVEKSSAYYYKDIFSDDSSLVDITLDNSYGSINYQSEAGNLYTDKSFSTLARDEVQNYILNNNDPNIIFSLLSLIVPQDKLMYISSPEDIYTILAPYVTDFDDCMALVNGLINQQRSAYDNFFAIYLYILDHKEITEEDFWNYANFVNLCQENSFIVYHYCSNDDKLYTREELLSMPVYDASKIIEVDYNSSDILPYDYNMFNVFQNVERIFNASNLPYTYMFLDNSYIKTWDIEDCKQDHVYVASEPVKYQQIHDKDNTYIYYEVPEGYEDGQAIMTFVNVAGIPAKCEYPGVRLTITSAGREKEIFLIESDRDYYPEIRFLKAGESLRGKSKKLLREKA